MIPETEIKRILFLQKAEVIDAQAEFIIPRLKEHFCDAEICLACSVEKVVIDDEFDLIITPTLEWLDEALAKLRRYNWIHFLSAGVDKIWNMSFDKETPILTKSSGVHALPMTEFVLAVMLYFTKKLGVFKAQSETKSWERHWLDELNGKRVFILGLGRVGGSVAERCSQFGMLISGTSRQNLPTAFVENVGQGDITSVLNKTDFLVVCLPLTKNTKGIVNEEFLKSLKPGAVLIDVSRGGVVCESAVLEALESKHLSAAALDVFETQPLPEYSKLWGREDVLITPHVSGTTPHYLSRALEILIENHKSMKLNGSLITPVDTHLGY
jgi:phosphoglycerate dehydrogenase-like enzyme